MSLLTRQASGILTFTKNQVVNPAFGWATSPRGDRVQALPPPPTQAGEDTGDSTTTSNKAESDNRNNEYENQEPIDDGESCVSPSRQTPPRPQEEEPPHEPQSPPSRPTLYQIQVLMKLWKYALVVGDASAAANRYSPNAVMIPLDGSRMPLTGRGAIKSYYDGFIRQYRPRSIKVLHGTVAIPTEDDNTEENGSWAQDNGVYDIVTHSGTLVRMRYTFVYLRDSKGRWKIVHHNSTKLCSIRLQNNKSVNIGCKTPQIANDAVLEVFPGASGGPLDEEEDHHPQKMGLPTEVVPRRRPSQLDHLVDLLTGTKSVTQNDLILLTMNKNKSGKIEPMRAQ